jgi:hypothetical protein
MAEIHDQLAAEGIVKETQTSRIHGKLATYGRLYVTNERVVFLRTNPLLGGLGAIGGALMALVKPKKVTVDIPRSSITGVQRGKYGPNKNILEISYAGSDEPAKFAVKPYEEWAAAVQPTAPTPAG